jgi:DNA mismatch endonuclease, patch repair protein
MTDVFSKTKRSQIMRAVRSRDTAPELALARMLRSMHVRYRRRTASLPGRPDFILPDLRAAILVHGCFWHQHKKCGKATLPKSNAAFWQKKLGRNVARDAHVVKSLRLLGFNVITIWECDLTAPDKVIGRLERTFDAFRIRHNSPTNG